jgi:hypothetical protein
MVAASRTVQTYEFVYPLRFFGGRRASWIETGVVELLLLAMTDVQVERESA